MRLPSGGYFNEQQKQCIEAIVAGKYHPHPFICFGPPGTGKTTVLCAAIEAVLRSSPKHRVFACAPSNSAADLFIERLGGKLDETQLFRLNATYRDARTASAKVLKYSSRRDDLGHFTLIPRDDLLKYRVVVSTCISGAWLRGLGCEPGDFTHVFIDEAGHCTEPESMATLGGLLDGTMSTRVILGGDPQQLGPIVRNPLALQHGLGVSWMERLIRGADHDDNSPYYRPSGTGPYPAHSMTKLLHNYRSHPDILAQPNQLFYENELIASADKMSRERLCRWSSFPGARFPILLHHVAGQEEREGTSPSWYNRDELIITMEFVQKLLETKSLGLSESDVGIITPYAKQASKLRELARRRRWNVGDGHLKIGSVEEFQGQERTVILISTVRSQIASIATFDTPFQLGFVKQEKRLNVAITRAKAGVIIVGNANVLETDARWRSVIAFIQAKGGIVGDYELKGSKEDADMDPASDPFIGFLAENANVNANANGDDDDDDFQHVELPTRHEE